MAAEVERQLAALRAALATRATPQRAVQEKRYLKSQLEFLGASLPVIRREARAFASDHPELDRRGARALAEAAWAHGVHELRSVAIGILEQRSELLRAADASWLIRLVARSDTWAHVDWLSIKVIGALTARHPALASAIDRWAVDDSLWVRRAALLSFHDPLRAGAGSFEHFARLAIPMLNEREFFIRKAIGWVLRARSLTHPEQVARFVSVHLAELSGVTFREATRRLPAALQKKLAAARGRSGRASANAGQTATAAARGVRSVKRVQPNGRRKKARPAPA